MKTLTIEHLKGYLGTDLKLIRENKSMPSDYHTMRGLSNENIFTQDSGLAVIDIYRVKPLLYPLSTLTEFREDFGFVLMDELFKIYNFSGNYEDMKNHIIDMLKTLICPQWILNLLYKWHIDIHGLIEQGLAIDKSKL